MRDTAVLPKADRGRRGAVPTALSLFRLSTEPHQFNFVVASNHRAVALWHRMGFDTVGCVPEAFHHLVLGYTDALVMYRRL